jgi:hypothetical protein
LPGSFIKDVFGIRDAIIGVADKIVKVNDARFVGVRQLHGACRGKTAKHEKNEAASQKRADKCQGLHRKRPTNDLQAVSERLEPCFRGLDWLLAALFLMFMKFSTGL